MENKTILGMLIALFMMTACMFGTMLQTNDVEVRETVINNTIVKEVPMMDNVTAEKISYLFENSDKAIEDKKEAKAIVLVHEEMATKNFRKKLAIKLINASADIEDYKDVEVSKYDIVDMDVDVDNENVTVKFYLELNRHEEAKIVATFEVKDLDNEDDFEEAEAEFESINVTRIFD